MARKIIAIAHGQTDCLVDLRLNRFLVIMRVEDVMQVVSTVELGEDGELHQLIKGFVIPFSSFETAALIVSRSSLLASVSSR